MSRDGASILETIGKIEQEYDDQLYVDTEIQSAEKCGVNIEQIKIQEPVAKQIEPIFEVA